MIFFFSFILQGVIQDVKIIPGPYGYLKQCPGVMPTCPSCGQFSLLEETIFELKQNLIHLKQRVM